MLTRLTAKWPGYCGGTIRVFDSLRRGGSRDDVIWIAGDSATFVEHAMRESRKLDMVYSSCEHLLLALLRDRAGAPAQALSRYGVHYEDAQAAVQWIHNAQPGETPPWTAPA